MSVISPARQSAPVVGRIGAGLDFTQLNNGLWRVTRADGSVLGYVEQPTPPVAAVSATKGFVAKRLSNDRRSFFTLGEFRSFTEALECLRFS
jgi:hypothetical protein